MTEWHELSAAWKAARESGERVLLFTLIDVAGSSYRKVGAHMLVTERAAVAGSVSAGCIEADLLARLNELLAGPLPQVLSYTNLTDDEFALNRGCNGDICIYVEEVSEEKSNSLTVYERAERTRDPQVHTIEIDDLRVPGGKRLFVERIQPPIRLYLFGSQRDAEPVARIAQSLDMDVVVLKKSQANELAGIDADARSGVVLMSHDFGRDCDALCAIAGKALPYVGIMGPCYRTEEMIKEYKSEITAKLHYPVGMSIGAEGANEIAVSIAAEIIDTFRRKSRKVATVVLAAGEAKRFGSPKQLSKHEGRSFVCRIAVEALRNPLSANTAVIVGAYADEVENELRGLPVNVVRNDRWSSGIGTSVAAAAQWAKENGFDGIILATCDQVLICAEHLARLVGASARTTIKAAEYAGTYGIPAYFDEQYFDELMALSAGVGAKNVIENYRDNVTFVPMPEAATDIDKPEQLHAELQAKHWTQTH